MKKKKPGFFASLFRRRKKGMELTVGSVLAGLAGGGIKEVRGTAPRVSAETVEPDRMAAEACARGDGFMAVFLGEAYPPVLILVAPGTDLAAIARGGKDPQEPPERLVGLLSRRAADFLSLGAGTAEGGAAGPEPLVPHIYVKKFGAADEAELSWRASGCVSYRLSLEGEETRLYACVDSGAAARAERGFADDDAYQAAVRRMVEAASKAEAAAPKAETAPKTGAAAPGESRIRSVRIGSPLEFLFGETFIKPRVKCGNHLLETRFVTAALGAGQGRQTEPGTWGGMTCRLQGKPWQAWYFLPEATGGLQLSRETARTLLGCIMKEALLAASALFSARPEDTRMVMDSKPDLSGKTGLLELTARVMAGAAAFPCIVYIEYSMLSPLLKAFLAPEEIASAPRGPFAVLPLVFSLNQSMLRRRLGTFHKDFTEPESGNPLPLAVFLDLLPDHDYAVILQNHALKLSGARGLRKLFFRVETVRAKDGREVSRVHTPHAFDEGRLLSFLPQTAREDWDAGKREGAGSEEEYVRLNAEMLEGIHRAAVKRILLLSPRALSILETVVMPAVRIRTKDELARAAAGGMPFASIRKLSKAQAQQFLSLQPNRLLCLALLGAEGELSFISANVSRKKRTALNEDLDFIRSQQARGLVEIAEVLEAKQELERKVHELSESRAREAAREKARRGGGGEPAGGVAGEAAGGREGRRVRYKGWATGKKRPEEPPQDE